MWQVKQSAEVPKKAEIYIYGDIVADKYSDEDISANEIRDKLKEIGSVDEIEIHINSLGGDVMAGTAIYNLLKQQAAKKTVYIDGFACSVASLIAMAGDRVIMPKNTMMMIHNCWTIAIGNADDLRKVADDLDKIMQSNKLSYLDKAGGKLSAELLDQLLAAETYLSAAECVELGLADEVLEYAVAAETIEQTITDSSDYQPVSNVAAFLQDKLRDESRQTETKSIPEAKQAPPSVDIEEQPEEPAIKQASEKGANFLAAFASAAEREMKK